MYPSPNNLPDFEIYFTKVLYPQIIIDQIIVLYSTYSSIYKSTKVVAFNFSATPDLSWHEQNMLWSFQQDLDIDDFVKFGCNT